MSESNYDTYKVANELREVKRFRTVEQAYLSLKEMDKDTAITKYWIRKQCVENKVQSIKIGKKMLVNFDDLIDKINNLI